MRSLGILSVIGLLGACSAVTDFDRFEPAPIPADDDDDNDDDVIVPPVGRPTEAAVVGGGSTTLQSGRYKLRVSVGAPQPAGSGANDDYRSEIGTGVVR